MMNARSSRGPRLLNTRLLFVALLFAVTAIGNWMIVSPKANGTKLAAVTGDISAGMPITDYATVDLPGNVVDPNFITADEMDAILKYEPIMLNSLASGDYLRHSDIYPNVDADGNPVGADGKALDPDTTGRLTDLLKGNSRIVSISGDPTTTFAKSGDMIDIYRVSGNGEYTQVDLCFSKKILYVVPRLVPSGTAADGFVPSGTSFILDLSGEQYPDQVAAAIIKLQESGKIRVSLGSPKSATSAGSCFTFGPTATPSPAPSATTNSGGLLPFLPSPSPAASPAPTKTP